MEKKLVERELQGVLLSILGEVIKSRGLEREISPHPIQEEKGADIIIKRPSGTPILLIELKDPRSSEGKSVFNVNTLQREVKRAWELKIRYLSISNFVDALFCDVRRGEILEFKTGIFVKIEEIDKFREAGVPTRTLITQLETLAQWYIDKCEEILQNRVIGKPIDEIFIEKIKSLINRYYLQISEEVWDLYNSNNFFRKKVQDYFKEQCWTIPTNKEDIEKLVYISLLILVSKLMFYKAMKDSRRYKKERLPELCVPNKEEIGKSMEEYLWERYFEILVEVTGDYELLIGKREEVINEIPFKSEYGEDFIKEIVECMEEYDFSKLNYDIIGKIFEELIKEEERHALGQYFTPSSVVDLINAFCIRRGDEKVLDPSCGSGTFLIRAYDRKKKLKNYRHDELLEQLHGVDVSSYAVYLSTFNLTIRDLVYYSYPRVFQRDFFDIKVGDALILKKGKKEEKVEFKDFDAIIGNPPYTRQEEIDELREGEKKRIIDVIEGEWSEWISRKHIRISRRSSIYAYFFYHAAKFLKNKGYLGFVTSNSYLDVDYGNDLRRFFLDHFRIVAIIDSKVERFFPSADVNTCITILQREEDDSKRKDNFVKFVYLKKRLVEIINRFGNVDNVRNFIENFSGSYYEDEYLKIKAVKQEELYDEDKWGKFLRAPEVYWKILERGKGKWIKLKDIAKVRFGIKTGANEFFYVQDVSDRITENDVRAIRNRGSIKSVEEIRNSRLKVVKNSKGELWLIEKEFLKPIVKSPREIKKYVVDEKDLKYKVLFIPKLKDDTDDIEELEKELRAKHPYVWAYIKYGERKGYHLKPTCKSRKPWYCLGDWKPADILTLMSSNDYHYFVLNKGEILEDARLYGIVVKDKRITNELLKYLLSMIVQLHLQLIGRVNFGEGVIDIKVYEIKEVPLLEDLTYIKTIDYNFNKKIPKLFEELNASTPEEVDLSKVNPDRLALDKAVLKAIGFKDEEIDDVLVELYKSVIDLVKSRLERAASVNSSNSSKEKIRIETLLEEIDKTLKEQGVKPKKSLSFVETLRKIIKDLTPVRKLQRKLFDEYWRKTFGEPFDEKSIQKSLIEYIK